MRFFLFLALAALAGCASPVVPVTGLDLQRYMGDWHVIANIPYFGEKDCYGSIERYRLLEDGRIDTRFIARKGSFYGRKYLVKSIARVVDKTNNSTWDVLFLGELIKVRLVILDVAPDYRYAVVATPDRRLAWIFCRKPAMPQRDYDAAVEVLETNRINTRKLAPVRQVPWA